MESVGREEPCAEWRYVGSADADCASLSPIRDGWIIGFRNTVFKSDYAVGGRPTGVVHVYFVSYRNSMQWPERNTRCHRMVGAVRSLDSLIGEQIDHGVDSWIGLFEAGEAACYGLARRDLTGSYGVREVARLPTPQIIAH
jgi:hypothetical protein